MSDPSTPDGVRMSFVVNVLDRASVVAKQTHDKAVKDGMSTAVADHMAVTAWTLMLEADSRMTVTEEPETSNPGRAPKWMWGAFSVDVLFAMVWLAASGVGVWQHMILFPVWWFVLGALALMADFAVFYWRRAHQ